MKNGSWYKPTVYGESRTIPGQGLKPSELLKRHLAGTLPDISSTKFEYHYDEEGNQIGAPLPLEMHEFHKLAVTIRKRQFEEATRLKAEATQKFKDQVIAEYVKLQSEKQQPEPQPAAPPDQKDNG